MPLTLGVTAKAVTINTANQYLNFPTTKGMNYDGDWFVYEPINSSNDAYGAKIIVYKWGDIQPTELSNNRLIMEGTMAMISEPWNGATVRYHGSSIEHVGSGVNDITGTVETDAFFFSHLGSLSPATDDDAFYWDRAFRTSSTGDWTYYQYHKHLPTSYPEYENGRMTHGAGFYINPSDKSFAYTINTKVRVSGVTYQSVLARVHTPSVGGAHNSHNDVTLPTNSSKNYQQGGILKGLGSRFHAFYIAPGTANTQQWSVFTRTYVDTSASFTAQNELGEFDLADPTINLVSQQCHSYPLRASAGDLLGTRIHLPVIINGTTANTYTLQDWSLTSSDSITGGSLVRTSLLTNQNTRPDCHMVTVGTTLYALSSDIANGGIRLYEYTDAGGWSANSLQVLTNSNTHHVRVHSLKYNIQDTKFYTLLSGNTSSTGTYTGAGLYTFTLGDAFAGYEHLDFDTANNAFVNRGALSNGHIIYTMSDASFKRSGNVEPQGIASGTEIMFYDPVTPNFFNRTETDLGGGEVYYQGIVLNEGSGRKLLGGKIERYPLAKNLSDDFLLSLVTQDNKKKYHFAWGGNDADDVVDVYGDDYITGMYQSVVDPDKVWLVGYTKSEMVSKRDMKVHGFCRNLTDAPNLLQWNDVVTDNTGNIYVTGTNSDGYAIYAKYNYDYVLQWQKQIGFASTDVVGDAISIDSNKNIYIVGSANYNVAVSKIDSNGTQIWTKTYGNAIQANGKGIAVVTKSNTEYVVTTSVEGSNTTFLVLDTSGNIIEQNKVADLVVNKVRNHKSTTDGKFLFSGTNGAGTIGKFGLGLIDGSNMVQWVSTYANNAYDISVIDSGATPGYIVCGKTTTSNAFALKVTTTGTEGSYSVSKSWATRLANTDFYSVVTSPVTDTNRYAYVVGKTPIGGTAAMGMDEASIVRFDNNGSLSWQNVFGHDMNESLNGITMDITKENIISCGWSESHSAGRDAIIFRSENGGFGTGVYHIAGNAGVPYYYNKSTLPTASDTNALTNLSAPTDVAALLAKDESLSFTFNDAGSTSQIFDGSYGANGLFMLWFGYVRLSKIQEYLNSEEYRNNQAAGLLVNYTKSIFTFYQASTVGDGSADDGNVFGYDIIEATDGTVWIAGQTSGDIEQTSLGESGVYDYLLVKFNPTTEKMTFYQNGTTLDEEIYSLCELSDGRIAFVGRTTGDITGGGGAGATPQAGGYDIFLGIFNPTSEVFDYYNIGSGLDDRGINLHDYNNFEANTLVVVYSSFGALANNTTNLGSEDIGAIKFNYLTDTWAANAYQTGTSSSDIFNQNGKHSVLLKDGRVAIVFATGGTFDMNQASAGSLDIALAILDFTTGQFTKAQVGSLSSEIPHSVFAIGDRLMIAGEKTESFGQDGQALFVESDVQFGLNGKSSTIE